MRGDNLKKYFNIIIVIIITFVTLVSIFTLKAEKVEGVFYYDENTIEDEAGYIFDNYYDVNINFK